MKKQQIAATPETALLVFKQKRKIKKSKNRPHYTYKMKYEKKKKAIRSATVWLTFCL